MEYTPGDKVEVISGTYKGRTGSFKRKCSHVFIGYCYVIFDLKPRERVERTQFIELKHIQIMETKSQPKMPMIQLSAIIIGKTNPRKVFDEDAITELSESIKAKGVIQPILLRPMGDTLELVCGERRYRASQMAGLFEIPAYIRELTDDEALEAQITENLQRKDVHPMEEAFAFKQMLEKFNAQEIAAKVGKKDYFIRQRLKLNDLTEHWQKIFYKNLIPVSDALKLAVLPIASQIEIMEDEGIDDDNIGHYDQPIEINEYQYRRSIGKLNDAAFDTKDPGLDRKAGSCGTCNYNSALSALFPEDVQNPKCSNITCFANKTDINFDIQVKIASGDPTITLISDNYAIDKKTEEKYKKIGHTVLTNSGYSDVGEDMNEPTLEDYKDDHQDEFDSEAELMESYNEEVDSFRVDKQKIEDEIAAGKYINAFYIDGNNKGKYTYIVLKKGGSAQSASKQNDNKSEPGIAEIDFEISRIRDREKRAKELDGEKVHTRIVDAVKSDKAFKTVPAKFTANDKTLMRFLIAEYVSYNNRDHIKKVIGITRITYGGGYAGNNPEKYFEQINALTDQQMAFLVRTIIFDKYNTNLPTGAGGRMLRKMAEDLGTVPIATYETEQKEKADKRQKNVDKRITELQEQKKLVKPKLKLTSKKKVTAK
jgi:ParB family chromosome partitioning protein